jgi:hypothetical protein
MPTLAQLIEDYLVRRPSATVRLDGKRWSDVLSIRLTQQLGADVMGGTVVGRNPPVTPRAGMPISWTWGYNGVEIVGFTGEVTPTRRASYPGRITVECADVLHRARRAQQVIATDPLNNITAKAAVEYILTHYGGIPASRLNIPTLSASGSEWVGSEWVLGTLTPVAWGNTETNDGGTTALRAAQEICNVLGYILYATAGGIVTARQIERRPSSAAFRVFERGVNLLVEGAPELTIDPDTIRNRIVVRGANTGVEGAQIMDAWQTSHPLLPSGVYQEDTFSSPLIEYVNESEAGAASASAITKRILKVKSRQPEVIGARIKADPRLTVGQTVGLVDSGVGHTTQKNYFLFGIDTDLDLQSGKFDQRLTLDGGLGNQGYTTIPPPEAAFTWRLVSEGLNGDSVVEVFVDGSSSRSLTSGEIVSWAWETSTTTYGTTPDTATGVRAVFFFLASEGTATITLTVTDTSSKTASLTLTIDLTGADSDLLPLQRVLSVAFGAAWYVSADGGQTWQIETSNGDAVAVPPLGAGVDSRSGATAVQTYGLIATRASGGTGLRRTLDTLGTPSTNLAALGGAIRCLWQNEASPARVWAGVGDTVYRSTDGGASFTAMAKPAAGTNINWIIEDPEVDNSVFVACGADLYHATAPTVGWVVLYEGPVGAAARQFIRSRDGQVTWIAYTGAPAGEALQRVESGALADFDATDVQTLALDKDASNSLATLYAITEDAELWSFDGLTGLSAAQSGQSFPAGTVPQHMLADPDVDLFYVAVFDSVASGTGSVFKYFSQPDELLLLKDGATGQQAHVIGLGGDAVGSLMILRPTIDGTGVWVWKATTQSWALSTSGLPADALAYVAADPNAPALRWIVTLAQAAVSGASCTPAYLTTNGGISWSAITVTATGHTTANLPVFGTNTIDKIWPRGVEFDDDGGWVMVGIGTANIGGQDLGGRLWVMRGTATSGTVAQSDDNAYRADGGSLALLAEKAVGATAFRGASEDKDYLLYTPNSGTTMTRYSVLAVDRLRIDRLYGIDRGVVGAANDIYLTQDAATDNLTEWITGQGEYVSSGAFGVYVGGRADGVALISDILGLPTVATVYGASTTVGAVRVDRRRGQAVAATTTSVDVYVFDGEGWATITGPAGIDAIDLSSEIDVMDVSG